jgi:hypothetical protein
MAVKPTSLDCAVGTSYMSDIRQMSVAMQRFVDLISMVTNNTLLGNNARAVTTMERNSVFCWVHPNIVTMGCYIDTLRK